MTEIGTPPGEGPAEELPAEELSPEEVSPGEVSPGEVSAGEVSAGEASAELAAGGRALRRELRSRLVAGELDAIVDQTGSNHQVLGALITLTYDGDPGVAWRAVHALGRAAERVARDAPDLVRRYLRRLFWLITEESGGICWFAPQAMAEVARTHESFTDFVPITMNLLGEMAEEDLQHFRPGILWAIGRLGPLAAPHMDDVRADVGAALDHPDATVRGLAAWALGETGRGDVVSDHPAVLEDPAPVTFFVDGERVETTVARLAREAVESAG